MSIQSTFSQTSPKGLTIFYDKSSSTLRFHTKSKPEILFNNLIQVSHHRQSSLQDKEMKNKTSYKLEVKIKTKNGIKTFYVLLFNVHLVAYDILNKNLTQMVLAKKILQNSSLFNDCLISRKYQKLPLKAELAIFLQKALTHILKINENTGTFSIKIWAKPFTYGIKCQVAIIPKESDTIENTSSLPYNEWL